ncbi:MAG: hypothetical protein ACR2QH_15105 [Geminicoccaceae bacterium]
MPSFIDRYKQELQGGGQAPSSGGTFIDRYKQELQGGRQAEPPDQNEAGFWDYPPFSTVAKLPQDAWDVYQQGVTRTEQFPYFRLPESIGQRSERTSQANLNVAPMAITGPGGAGGANILKRIVASGGSTAAADASQQAMEQGQIDPIQTAVAGGLGAAGQGAGELIGAGLTRFANRKAARDIARLDPERTGELRRIAEAEGIQLTPAELTGMPSLAQQQKQLGQTIGAGDDLADFYRMRAGEQIDPAINRYLDSLSTFQGDEAAGELTRAAANRAMDTVAQIRADQARPLYNQAFAEARPVDLSGVMEAMNRQARRFPASGRVNQGLRTVTRLLGNTDDAGNFIPDTDMVRLHGAKVEIDQILTGIDPETRVGPQTAAAIRDVRSSLLSALDEASPTYADARAIFADLSPGMARVREGVAGTIAELPDQQLKTVAARLFEVGRSPGPRAVGEARRQLQAADPEAWQAIKRAYVEGKWIDAANQTIGSKGEDPINAGAKFRLALLGNGRKRQILEQALDPEEFRALNNLSRVLEASGRVKPIGSDTAWNQEAIKIGKSESANVISKVMKYSSPDILKDAAATWDEANFLRHSEHLVQMITSPDGISLLRELRQISPHAQFARAILGRAVVLGSAEAAGIRQQAGPEDNRRAIDVPNAQSLSQGAMEPSPGPGMATMDTFMQNQQAAQAAAEKQNAAILEELRGLRSAAGGPAQQAPAVDPQEMEMRRIEMQMRQVEAANQIDMQRQTAERQEALMQQQLDLLNDMARQREPVQAPKNTRTRRRLNVLRDETGRFVGVDVDNEE